MPCGRKRHNGRGGYTLIEAVVGSAMLAAVLVAILIGAGRLTAQSAAARQCLVACEIADGLLADWWGRTERIPRSGEGAVPGHRGWRWRTRVVENSEAKDMGGQVVALDLFAPEQERHSGGNGPSFEVIEPGAAILTVDVLVAEGEADGT